MEKVEIKVSRQMSDRVFNKITGCQLVGGVSFVVGILCTIIGLINEETTAMIIGFVNLGNALAFSFLTGHFNALYPITKNAENQIGIDNEKYNFVRDTTEDVSK